MTPEQEGDKQQNEHVGVEPNAISAEDVPMSTVELIEGDEQAQSNMEIDQRGDGQSTDPNVIDDVVAEQEAPESTDDSGDGKYNLLQI